MRNSLRDRIHQALDTDPPAPDLAHRVLNSVRTQAGRGDWGDNPTSMSPLKGRVRMLAIPASVAIGVAVVLATWRLGSPIPSRSAPITSNMVSAAIDIQTYFSRFELDSPELMCKASLVMDTHVDAVGPSHWNTPDGARPPNADKDLILSKGYQIVAPIRSSRNAVLLDQRHAPTTEFVTLGGQIGQDRYRVDGFPQLSPGRRYLVVFTAGLAGGTGVTQSVLVAYNAFPIDSQEMVLLRQEVVEQGRVSQKQVKLPLAQIVQQLSRCS